MALLNLAAIIFLIYLLGSSAFLLISIALILNHFIKKPFLILSIFSPLVFIYSLYLSKLEQGPVYDLIRTRFKIGSIETLTIILISLIVCYFLYVITLKIYRRLDTERRHPLAAVLCLFVMVFLLSKAEIHLRYWPLMITILQAYFASIFVMLAYDLKDDKELSDLSTVSRFSMLSTMHSTFFQPGGTQLSPKGLKELRQTLLPAENQEYWQIAALKMLLLCVALRFIAVLLGHLFLGLENISLIKLHIPAFPIMEIDMHKTIPRYYAFSQHVERSQIYLLVFIRSIHWFIIKYIGFNSKIALLWFMGFPIELGILNPFRASSFVDFFRRTHVYVAHFYRVFIYPYVSSLLRNIKNIRFKKYLAIWLMIILGGFLYQTVSHSYQMFWWERAEFYQVMLSRLTYNCILATAITVSLYIEKRFPPKQNVLRIFRGSLYLVFYTVVMSLSASSKFQSFHAEDLIHYLLFLVGFGT